VANTITNVTPQLLAQGLLALRQDAIMPRVVNRSYDTIAMQKGDVVNIPIPSAIAARNVTPGVTTDSNVDSSPTVALVTLDNWKESPFYLTDKDAAAVMTGTVPMQASEAIKSLANAIDDAILANYTGIYGFAGTAGTTPFNGSLTAAASARTLLNRQLAGRNDRRAVIDPDADGNLLLNAEILKANERGDTAGLVEGIIARKLGFDWFMDQNIPTHTVGTGWATGFSISTVSGGYGLTTVNVLNATASGQIKVGDVFKVAGNSQQYVVTVTNTVSATVAVVITFSPAFVTAYATAAALTVIGTNHVVNLAFHRDAFAFASRLLGSSAGLGVMQSAVDPISGVALRLELSRQHRQDTYAYDSLWGDALVRPSLAVRIGG
jgi:hypothetical protein